MSVVTAAPLDRAWSALADPDHLSHWLADRVEGSPAAGGSLGFFWDSLGVAIDLEVMEVEPRRRLVLRGAPPGRPPQVQRIEVTATGGGTRIDLEHAGFASADEAAGSLSGWRTSLALLRLYLDRYYGQGRLCAATLGTAVVSFDRLFAHYTAGAGLSRWLLAAPVDFGEEGEPCRLPLRGGLELCGEVLARTAPREIAFRCDEIDGAVALRALSVDGADHGAKVIGAQLHSWAPASPALPGLRAELERAVDRLVAALGGGAAG